MKATTGLISIVWLALTSIAMAQVAENPWQPDSQLPRYDFFESVCLAKMIAGSTDQLGLIIPTYRQNAKSIVVQVSELRTETRTRRVQLDDGTVGTQEYAVTVPQLKEVPQTVMVSEATGTRRINLPLSKVQVWDWSLKLATDDSVRDRLSKARHVVLLREPLDEDKSIGPYYRRVLSPEILFIYVTPLDLISAEIAMSAKPSAE